jgi:hypothetical protein
MTTSRTPLQPLTLLLAGALLTLAACNSEVTDQGPGAGGSTTSSSTTSATGAQGGSGATGAQGGSGATGAEGGSAGAGGGPVDCNPTGVACNGMPPVCDPGEVPSVIDLCWGPCVPILSCAAEDSCAGCDTGFCAAYVAWTTEYRCVMPSLQCSALACSCLNPYFCVEPFSACVVNAGSDQDVSCECPSC